MIIYYDEQNSESWFKRRKGKLSSSRVKNVLIDKIANKTELQSIILKPLLDEIPSIEGTVDKKEIAAIKKQIAEIKKDVSLYSQGKLESLIPKEKYEEFWYLAQKKEYYRLLAEQMGYEDDESEDPRERGHRLEDEAAEKLELETGEKTEKVGICTREDYTDISFSPDRLIFGGKTQSGFKWYSGGVEIKSPGVVNHLEIVMTNKIPDEYWDQCIQYFVVCDEMKYLYFVSYNPIIIEKPIIIIKIERKDVEKDIRYSLERQKSTIDHIKSDILKLTF